MADRTHSESPIEEARQEARNYIGEAWPTAIEVCSASPSMYEFDAICLDDAPEGIASISIMHDPEADTFALVENPYIDPEAIKKAERDLTTADLLSQIELKIMMLMQNSETEDEIAAAWAAVSSTTAQSARLRLCEIGGDVDEARRCIDGLFLLNPEL